MTPPGKGSVDSQRFGNTTSTLAMGTFRNGGTGYGGASMPSDLQIGGNVGGVRSIGQQHASTGTGAQKIGGAVIRQVKVSATTNDIGNVVEDYNPYPYQQRHAS